MSKRLRLILGDQLNIQHSWFLEKEEQTTYVLIECLSEATYVRHHIQKIVGFFLAMRSFRSQIEKLGHQVKYVSLDDPDNKKSISANLKYLVEKYQFDQLDYQLPDEYRLDQELQNLQAELPIPVVAVDSEHFLTERKHVEEMFAGKKQFLMESFYRKIRKQYQILMEADGKTPISGRWNYDAENRKKLPKKIDIPQAPVFTRDVSDLIEMIESKGIATIGTIQVKQFDWPITREENLDLLQQFLVLRLSNFGRYQDAMTDRNYLLFHSKLSFGLNTKLIHPKEVVDACVAYWKNNEDTVELAQVEGFIRQIIGWREYMRGIYWAKMPEFATLNYFNHEAKLPGWYWNGETKMNCLSHSIKQSLEYAYAHHIQRLMVTGNFALLLGVHPDEIDQWYLGIYMDAIEWVEITNTRGMSQFADGGIVGTKPYVSSANYIHKMGDYCSNCHYDRKAKTGPNACPFNSLYWDFYARNAALLEKNPRIGMMYRVWNKMNPEDQNAILEQAKEHKENAENL